MRCDFPEASRLHGVACERKNEDRREMSRMTFWKFALMVVRFPIFQWGFNCEFAKYGSEMPWRGETKVGGDGKDWLIGVTKKPFSLFDLLAEDEFGKGHTRFLLEFGGEIGS